MNTVELAPGRVYLECGPVSMVLVAWQEGRPQTGLCRQGAEYAVQCLASVSQQIELLKQPWPECDGQWLQGIARTMWQAVRATRDPELTAMAAVAGAMADAVADWLAGQGATKVMVNNGGDIAIRLKEDERVTVGIMPKLGEKRYSSIITLTDQAGVGGIATSGLGGRSFTRGIADAVTVLAATAAVADAFATSLANASLIAAPGIEQVPAGRLDPNTDIPDLPVTVRVGPLDDCLVQQSLRQVMEKAQQELTYGNIRGISVQVQGSTASNLKDCMNQ